MVLSKADKEEIAAMFNAFAERMGPERQYMAPGERLIDEIAMRVGPRIQPGLETFSSRMGSGRQYTPIGEQIVGGAIETALVPSKRKKAMTKFNKAVKEGMKIVKASSSYGKKGTISNSKKAFAAVTKSVSKARKGGKLPKKGVLRTVQSKAKGILGRIQKKQRRGKKKPKTLGELAGYGRRGGPTRRFI
tara:strand:+ start:616 stop:1185 length:570 start_codon:yes stop_codon:yes gene_type:complete